MKASYFLNRRALFTLLLAALCICSCKQEENEDDTLTRADELAASQKAGAFDKVRYVFGDGMGGSGIPTEPVVVQGGETRSLTFIHQSTYTDTNGKTYSCEPTATVAVRVSKDTLYVKKLSMLTDVTQPSEPALTNSGTNPVRNRIKQMFDVGGQEIAFDMNYEVYRYAVSDKTIEMPYIKLHPATPGGVEATLDDHQVSDGIVDIRMDAPTATRSDDEQDNHTYQVSVTFHLDVASQHTDNDITAPLSFEVEYIAVVEDVTELPDPSLESSYQLNILGGTSNTASPFELTKGEKLSLEWIQNSRYTYFSATEFFGRTITQKPRATVNVSVLHDTLQLGTIHELEKAEELPFAEETSGEEPTKHVTKQSFKVGEQVISIDWSYETFAPLDVEGEQVLLPYLELGKAELVNMNFTEVQSAELPNEADKAYEVTMRFRQKLTGVHTTESISEDIEYVVKYIAVLENKLISTTYEKDYGWQEGHDNLLPATYYLVRRIRTYANGDKITDTFVEGGRWPVERRIDLTSRTGDSYKQATTYQYNNDIVFVYHAGTIEKKNDYSVRIFHKTGVPDIGRVSYTQGGVLDTWNERNLSYYTYIGNTFKYNSDNPVEGWYVYGIEWQRIATLRYILTDNDSIWIEIHNIVIKFYDRFLYLDGQVFDFSEYRMTYDSDFREEPMTLADGTQAKVFTHELKAKYLGRDYYEAIVDTVYQLPK